MAWTTEIGDYGGKYSGLQYLQGKQKPEKPKNVGEASYRISKASINIFNKRYVDLAFLGGLSLYSNPPDTDEWFGSLFSSSFVVNVDFLKNKENPNKNFVTTLLAIPLENCYYTVLGYQSSNDHVGTEIYYVKELKATYQKTELSDAENFYRYGSYTINASEGRNTGFFPFLLDTPEGIFSGVGFIAAEYNSQTQKYTYGSGIASLAVTDESIFGDYKKKVDKSDEYGDESNNGGYGGGSFDDSSDNMGLPELPSIGVSDTGFVNVYKISKNELRGFVDELFPDFDIPTPSTQTGIDAVAENLANTVQVIADFANSYINKGLVEYVIDCHIVPVTPTTTQNTGLKVGFKTFSYNPSKVTSDYVRFDCGSLTIPEYYQNFLDYSGTRAKLYLPFIGFVDVKAEWFQSGKLQVIYHFNIIDGSCIAFIIGTSSKSKLKETVVANFGGNCCVHMPITGVNYSSMISGIAGGVGKVAAGIATGSVSTALNGIENAVTARPDIQQSNGYNAGMSFMSYRQPYLLIERAVASFSKNYPKEKGLPLNVTKKLGDMKGFTTCNEPVVDNFHCLEEEKEMIKQALIEGTIF